MTCNEVKRNVQTRHEQFVFAYPPNILRSHPNSRTELESDPPKTHEQRKNFVFNVHRVLSKNSFSPYDHNITRVKHSTQTVPSDCTCFKSVKIRCSWLLYICIRSGSLINSKHAFVVLLFYKSINRAILTNWNHWRFILVSLFFFFFYPLLYIWSVYFNN